jgi:hypothetical protein
MRGGPGRCLSAPPTPFATGERLAIAEWGGIRTLDGPKTAHNGFRDRPGFRESPANGWVGSERRGNARGNEIGARRIRIVRLFSWHARACQRRRPSTTATSEERSRANDFTEPLAASARPRSTTTSRSGRFASCHGGEQSREQIERNRPGLSGPVSAWIDVSRVNRIPVSEAGGRKVVQFRRCTD